MSVEGFDSVEGVTSALRARAYEAVSELVPDDNNFERGVERAQAVADAVLAEFGTAGLTGMMVELSLKLAETIERIATNDGVPAADLAEVWFVD